MKKIEDELVVFKGIMKAISNTFGNRCEVVLHDWSKGYDHTIIAIENGFITNRSVGDCGSNLGLEVMRGTVKNGDMYNYITKTSENTTLRSSTTYIRDDDGNTIGALCINFNITDLIEAENVINSFTIGSQDETEIFARDVSDLLNYLLSESMKISNKPVSEMSKEDKIAAIRYLDEKGAFLITKSGNKVCEFFNISKFSLYNYLDEIRSTPTVN